MLTSTSCLLVYTLESFYLIRCSVYCRWDPLHRIPKMVIMISRALLHRDDAFWGFFCHLTLQAFLLTCLYECQDFIFPMKKSVNYSLFTQPILCSILKSLMILTPDILIRINRCFVSTPSHSLSWSMFCASVAYNPHFFFNSTGKRLARFSCSKGLTYFNFSEIQLASRISHG